MICLCGKYLSDDVIPSYYLHLLLSDEDVKRVLVSIENNSLAHPVKSHSLQHKRAIIQNRSAFYNASVQMFDCPNCGRLHIFWQQNQPATSYQLRLEKPVDKTLDKLGPASCRLLPDTHYDQLMNHLPGIDSNETKLDLPAFLDQLICLSKQVWLYNGLQQIVIEWESEWISEYLYEYRETPQR